MIAASDAITPNIFITPPPAITPLISAERRDELRFHAEPPNIRFDSHYAIFSLFSHDIDFAILIFTLPSHRLQILTFSMRILLLLRHYASASAAVDRLLPFRHCCCLSPAKRHAASILKYAFIIAAGFRFDVSPFQLSFRFSSLNSCHYRRFPSIFASSRIDTSMIYFFALSLIS
jgi:hypothetical protein